MSRDTGYTDDLSEKMRHRIPAGSLESPVYPIRRYQYLARCIEYPVEYYRDMQPSMAIWGDETQRLLKMETKPKSEITWTRYQVDISPALAQHTSDAEDIVGIH